MILIITDLYGKPMRLWQQLWLPEVLLFLFFFFYEVVSTSSSLLLPTYLPLDFVPPPLALA